MSQKEFNEIYKEVCEVFAERPEIKDILLSLMRLQGEKREKAREAILAYFDLVEEV